MLNNQCLSEDSSNPPATSALTRLTLWRDLFMLHDDLLNVLIGAIGYWKDPLEGEREVIFFITYLIAKSHENENGPNATNAHWNADLNSIKQSLYNLSRSGGTLDPLFPTAYLTVRYSKQLNKMIMACDLTYKGKIYIYKKRGYIHDVTAELVYENDKFNWINSTTRPEHEYNPFDYVNKKGALLGGYVVTTRPTGEVEAEFFEAKYLWDILSLSKSPKILTKWQTKMLKKTILNQASKSWSYYQPEENAETLESPEESICDGVINYDVFTMTKQSDLTKNALIYAGTLFSERDNEVTSILSSLMIKLDIDDKLNALPAFSKLAMYLALCKYNLSVDDFHKEAYLSTQNYGMLKLLNVSVMYKGLRAIAFNGKLKTTKEVPNKIDFKLVHKNDVFTFNGSDKRPDFSVDVTKPRGEMIGGYVVVTRGENYKCVCISREVLVTVASCAYTKAVQKRWPRQYFEVKLLRQTFEEWV